MFLQCKFRGCMHWNRNVRPGCVVLVCSRNCVQNLGANCRRMSDRTEWETWSIVCVLWFCFSVWFGYAKFVQAVARFKNDANARVPAGRAHRAQGWQQLHAHTGNRTQVTSMGGLYDTTTLCVLLPLHNSKYVLDLKDQDVSVIKIVIDPYSKPPFVWNFKLLLDARN